LDLHFLFTDTSNSLHFGIVERALVSSLPLSLSFFAKVAQSDDKRKVHYNNNAMTPGANLSE